jgi:hypothetical protein
MILLNVLISVGSISATLVCIREYRRRQQLRLIIARRRNGYLRVEVGQSKNEAGIVMQHFVSARIVCKNNEALHYKRHSNETEIAQFAGRPENRLRIVSSIRERDGSLAQM